MGELLHSRLLPRLVGWLMALVPALGVAQAEPQGTEPVFSWNAPEGCPTQGFVVAELERLLGQPVTRELSAEKAFDVQVAQLPGRGFRATLLVTTSSQQGERTIGHADCQELARVVALVVALTIDPEAVRQHEAAPAATEPAATEPAATEPAATEPAATEPAPNQAPTACRCQSPLDEGIWQKLVDVATPCPALSCPVQQPCRPSTTQAPSWQPPSRAHPSSEVRPPFAWFIEAGLGAASGVLPSMGPTVGADAGVELEHRWRFEIGGRYWVRQEYSPENYPSVRTAVRMLSGGARLCGLPFVADWRLVGCLGPELGDYRVASLSGPSEGSVQRGRWSAIMGSVGAYFPLSAVLELGTRVDGGPVINRPAVAGRDADGEWVRLTEAKAFVGSFAVTLLFKGQGAD